MPIATPVLPEIGVLLRVARAFTLEVLGLDYTTHGRTSMFGYVLLSESALSLLGLGVPPPAPTWGNMLAGARPYIGQAMWLGTFPGLCISLTLLGINLLGDAMRDRRDPRMRGTR